MAQISIEELYCGEGGGAKYCVGGIMGAVMQEILIHGVPTEYDERMYIELLIVKHTLKAAEQMKTESDFVSGIHPPTPKASARCTRSMPRRGKNAKCCWSR